MPWNIETDLRNKLLNYNIAFVKVFTPYFVDYFKDIRYGDSCKKDQACRTYRAVCVDNKCGCPSTRDYTNQTDSCVLSKFLFILIYSWKIQSRIIISILLNRFYRKQFSGQAVCVWFDLYSDRLCSPSNVFYWLEL